jgi:beta-galactosidase
MKSYLPITERPSRPKSFRGGVTKGLSVKRSLTARLVVVSWWLFIGCGLVLGQYNPPSSHRIDALLNDSWAFHLGDVAGAQSNNFNDSAWTPVSIPHTWNNLDGQDGGNNYYRGIGWYRRHLPMFRLSYISYEYFLKFDAANLVADVYVNGTFVGEHQGGFSAFVFDVTSFIKIGDDNIIAVKVNNAFNADIPPLQADFTFFGGLYRNVHLLATDKLHVSPLDYGSPGVYLKQTNVSSNSADLQITTKVRNDGANSQHAIVKSAVVDAAGKIVASLTTTQTVAAATTVNVIQGTTISSPHLWNGRADPYLYKAFIQVSDSGTNADLVEQPLGFRYFSVDPNTGFHLNGKYLDLHGVSFHQDRLNKGWAISDGDQEEDIGMIMEIGATVVRLSHYQHPQKTYDLCDKNGLVAWSEIPLIDNITDSVNFSNSASQQLVEMIRQNYNHPSICFWGIYNEILLKKGPDPRPLVQALNRLAKAEDTTRPTTSASCCVDDNDPINWYVDVPSFNRYFGWYWGDYNDFGLYIDRTHSFTNLPAGISEYGAGASLTQHLDNPPKPVNPNDAGVPHYEEYQDLLHEATWQQMQSRPYLWIKAVWNMFDFASDSRVESTAPGRNDKGLVTYDRQTRKDAFYWYKANWTTNAFVYITSRRFSPRGPAGAKVPVKVYANCNSVQLLFNGVLEGTLASTNHIYGWSGLALASGSNTVVAIGTMGSRSCTDSVVWISTSADVSQ